MTIDKTQISKILKKQIKGGSLDDVIYDIGDDMMSPKKSSQKLRSKR